jgi:hypothetical protein
MAMERKLTTVAPVLFTADGTQFGLVTVADTIGFYVKGYAFISSDAQPVTQVQIQVVLSSTQMVVGKVGTTPAVNNFVNISAYTVADGASIGFPEQDKNKIKPDDIQQAIYAADPIVADRVIQVDPYGNFYTEDNPLPTTATFSGTISVGAVEVKGTNGNYLEPNSDGSINVDATIVNTNPIDVNVVNAAPNNKTLVNEYNKASSVPVNTLTTIVTYTVGAGLTAILERISASGQNIGIYQVLINGDVIETQSTYWSNFNLEFNFTSPDVFGTPLVAGDEVEVTVINYSPSLTVADFYARIQVVEVS